MSRENSTAEGLFQYYTYHIKNDEVVVTEGLTEDDVMSKYGTVDLDEMRDTGWQHLSHIGQVIIDTNHSKLVGETKLEMIIAIEKYDVKEKLKDFIDG